MNIFAIFPDTLNNSMAVHDMPVEALTKFGVICEKQEKFFNSTIHQISPNDVVILWIGSKDESRLNSFANLNCRKLIKNIDSCSSDRILFKRELELYPRLGLESLLVTYCTDYNMQFLAKHGIKAIKYPHLLDFEKFGKNKVDKKFDIFISGHLSEKSYPLRHKLANFLFKKQDKYQLCYLPHPGYRLNNLAHQVYGQKYIDLASSSYLSIVCTGDDDSLVVKYLEFAAALTLPMGDAPSNMPTEARNQMILVSKHQSNEELENAIDETLANKSILQTRIFNYRSCMQNNFDVEKTESFIKKIVHKQFDNQD